MDSPARILLVDDHKFVRDALKAHFIYNDKYQIVGEAANRDELLNELAEKEVDVVLLDVILKGLDIIPLIEEVLKSSPGVRVVMLTMLAEKQYIKATLDAGASGYLLKDCDYDDVYRSISAAIKGDQYFCPSVTRLLAQGLETEPLGLDASSLGGDDLTAREEEVLDLILQQNSNQEIADKLFISKRTVEVHKKNILDKKGARSITGLILQMQEGQSPSDA